MSSKRDPDPTIDPSIDPAIDSAIGSTIDRRRFAKLVAASGGALGASMFVPKWTAPYVELGVLMAQPVASVRFRPDPPGVTSPGGGTTSSCPAIQVTFSNPTFLSAEGTFDPPADQRHLRLERRTGTTADVTVLAGTLRRPTGGGPLVLTRDQALRIDLQLGATIYELQLSWYFGYDTFNSYPFGDEEEGDVLRRELCASRPA